MILCDNGATNNFRDAEESLGLMKSCSIFGGACGVGWGGGTVHITMGSWKVRENQYIQFVRVLYCKLPTNNKQVPAFPLEAVPGTKPWPQRWEARVLPLCHHGPEIML